MALLNGVLRAAFDGFLLPFRDLPAWVGLTVVSALTGVAMLLIFKATSNQVKLEAVKRQIHAGLFEIRLFNDDLRAILGAQGRILRHNLSYLRLSAVPLVFILPPLVFAMAQLQAHYGYRGLEAGATALLAVELEEGAAAARPDLALELPPGLALDAPPVWIPSQREMAWRLRAEESGDYQVRVRLAGREVEKSVRVSDRIVRRSPYRVRGFWSELLWPGEPPLPGDSPIAEIRLAYPEREVEILGVGLHWLIWFFALSIVFAFALRKPLGVTI